MVFNSRPMFLQKLYLCITKVDVPKNQKFTPDLMEPFMYVEKVMKNLYLIIQLTFNPIQQHVKTFMRYVCRFYGFDSKIRDLI